MSNKNDVIIAAIRIYKHGCYGRDCFGCQISNIHDCFGNMNINVSHVLKWDTKKTGASELAKKYLMENCTDEELLEALI